MSVVAKATAVLSNKAAAMCGGLDEKDIQRDSTDR